jgi:hypothetical protein
MRFVSAAKEVFGKVDIVIRFGHDRTIARSW